MLGKQQLIGKNRQSSQRRATSEGTTLRMWDMFGQPVIICGIDVTHPEESEKKMRDMKIEKSKEEEYEAVNMHEP